MSKLEWAMYFFIILGTMSVVFAITFAASERNKEACEFLFEIGYDSEYKPFPNGRCFVDGEIVSDMDDALKYHLIETLKEEIRGETHAFP